MGVTRGYGRGLLGICSGEFARKLLILDSFGVDLVLENEREWGTGVRGNLQFVQQFWEVMWYN